jgi:hypothetical protein
MAVPRCHLRQGFPLMMVVSYKSIIGNNGKRNQYLERSSKDIALPHCRQYRYHRSTKSRLKLIRFHVGVDKSLRFTRKYDSCNSPTRALRVFTHRQFPPRIYFISYSGNLIKINIHRMRQCFKKSPPVHGRLLSNPQIHVLCQFHFPNILSSIVIEYGVIRLSWKER